MPFFNKLRKAQIKTDGLKRYLLYAVGEIVLVVVLICGFVVPNGYCQGSDSLFYSQKADAFLKKELGARFFVKYVRRETVSIYPSVLVAYTLDHRKCNKNKNLFVLNFYERVTGSLHSLDTVEAKMICRKIKAKISRSKGTFDLEINRSEALRLCMQNGMNWNPASCRGSLTYNLNQNSSLTRWSFICPKSADQAEIFEVYLVRPDQVHKAESVGIGCP